MGLPRRVACADGRAFVSVCLEFLIFLKVLALNTAVFPLVGLARLAATLSLSVACLAASAQSVQPPEIAGRAYLLYDVTSSQVLAAKDPDMAVEPASLTKLMTAYIVLAAIRDAESRVMFIGYNPLWYKLAIWTLSAVLCGIAGALYVPQVGIINPSEMSPAASIEMAIWAAVGGRGTLIGPILGAFFVNGAKSWLTVTFPEFWLYFLGALFIVVTLWMPQGVVGLVTQLKKRAQR